MQQRTIDLGSVYRYSIQQFKRYASFIIGVTVTYYVLAIIPRIYYVLTAPEDPLDQSRVVSFLLTMIQLYLGLGFTRVMLLLADDLHAEVGDLFNGLRMFISYFVGSFLYGIAVLIGLFLLVVPGILAAIRLQFYPYYIIEEGDNAFAALHKSYDDTRNLTLELFLFGITVVAANIAGVLLLGVGFIITYPITTLATVVIYKGIRNGASELPTENYFPKS